LRELQLRTHAPAQTREVAAVLAGVLRPGDVLALTGELGAGKTAFVQGAAAALGVTERVTSPTFVLRREYEGRLRIVHVDVYRLDTLSDVAELGEEIFDPDHVTFVEWADAARPLLPPDYLEVELRTLPVDPDAAADRTAQERRMLLRPHGEDWRRRLGTLFDRLRQWATVPATGAG
jgi:tRNA threonylcarbamoyladenosine biosynthesis protein TsaE